MSEVSQDEFVDIGSRMAQDLQDFIAEAEKAGCENPLPGTKALIDEWEAIFNRCSNWQQTLKGQDEKGCGIASLDKGSS